MSNLPTYDQLPIDPKHPAHTAWGVWGEEDNLGTLNLLTAECVAEASQCIKQGKIYALNWELEQPNPPLFGRPAIKHHIQPHTEQKVSFDDMYDGFNPQSSSQWDGLRHVCHFPTLKFYNGVNPADVANGVGDRLGIHHMARRGIAGRAVLLDFARWAEKHRPDFDPLQRHEVTVEELEQVAKEQGVTFKVGDILLVRTGWIAAYKKLGGGKYCEKFDYKNPSAAGVKACQETYAWIWNNHFAAVAGDVFAFEAFPPKSWDDSCHSMFLGAFGMPIGEMFDLDALAEDSAKDGVYEYFFTSAPLNKLQGVASPPNAICIK
ncbi:hypothetical protein VTP01DRAFT_5540 [Rhizomucor pusillus]|uniref:uncharacterized protein n=1 Tax=Rhizomucor pusillus TaxID=4840 RepID=UPI003742E2D1